MLRCSVETKCPKTEIHLFRRKSITKFAYEKRILKERQKNTERGKVEKNRTNII